MVAFVLMVGALIAIQPSDAPSAAPAVQAASRDLRQAPFADLVGQLPEAGEELVWDANAKEWKEHAASAELRARLLKDGLSDEQWVQALTAARVIAFHQRWPKDRLLAISMRAPRWLGQRGEIKARPKTPGGPHLSTSAIFGGCALGNDALRERRDHMAVGKLPPGTTEVVFEIKIEATPLARGDTGRTRFWNGTLRFPISLVEKESDVMQPVSTPETDQAVRDAISVSVGPNQGTPPEMSMWVRAQRDDRIERLVALRACTLNVQVLDGGTVVGTEIVDLRRTPRAPACDAYRTTLKAAMLRDDALDRLRLRITGEPMAAFEDLRRDSYWAGTIEAPLRDFIKP